MFSRDSHTNGILKTSAVFYIYQRNVDSDTEILCITPSPGYQGSPDDKLPLDSFVIEDVSYETYQLTLENSVCYVIIDEIDPSKPGQNYYSSENGLYALFSSRPSSCTMFRSSNIIFRTITVKEWDFCEVETFLQDRCIENPLSMAKIMDRFYVVGGSLRYLMMPDDELLKLFADVDIQYLPRNGSRNSASHETAAIFFDESSFLFTICRHTEKHVPASHFFCLLNHYNHFDPQAAHELSTHIMLASSKTIYIRPYELRQKKLTTNVDENLEDEEDNVMQRKYAYRAFKLPEGIQETLLWNKTPNISMKPWSPSLRLFDGWARGVFIQATTKKDNTFTLKNDFMFKDMLKRSPLPLLGPTPHDPDNPIVDYIFLADSLELADQISISMTIHDSVFFDDGLLRMWVGFSEDCMYPPIYSTIQPVPMVFSAPCSVGPEVGVR